ncbi:hypothetical protein BJ165DRAFT_1404960 [Panaeolus papilionaceus]|nr:hypothetical protein BJ165DRAFT_1404960 [Panaeolus papilionaceus]
MTFSQDFDVVPLLNLLRSPSHLLKTRALVETRLLTGMILAAFTPISQPDACCIFLHLGIHMIADSPPQQGDALPAGSHPVPPAAQPTNTTIPPPALSEPQTVAPALAAPTPATTITQMKPEPLDDLPIPDQAPNAVPAVASARTNKPNPAPIVASAPINNCIPTSAPANAPALIDVHNPTPEPDVPPAYIGEDVVDFFNLPHVAYPPVANNGPDNAGDPEGAANNEAEVHPAHAGNAERNGAMEGRVEEQVGQAHNAQGVVITTTDEEEDIGWVKRKRGGDGFQVDETRSWKKTKDLILTFVQENNLQR